MNTIKMLSVLLFAVLNCSSGCGPFLARREHKKQYFRSARMCSQGPLEVEVQATGYRWGEDIALKVYSPRPLSFQYVIDIGDEKKVSSGRIGRDDENVENSRCVLSEKETLSLGVRVETEERQGREDGVDSEWIQEQKHDGKGERIKTEVHADSSRESSHLSTGEKASLQILEPVSEEVGLQKIRLLQEKTKTRVYTISLLGRNWPVRYRGCANKSLHPNPYARSTEVRIRIWSREPNDLDGVVFAVLHNHHVPTVNESKWLSYVQKQIRKCEEREAEKRQRELERLRKRQHEASFRTIRLTKTVGAEIVSETRFVDGRKQVVSTSRGGLTFRLPDKYDIKKHRKCFRESHRNNTECWGEMGRDEFQEAHLQKALQGMGRNTRVSYSLNETSSTGQTVYDYSEETSYRCVLDLNSRRCWGKGGYRAFRKKRIAEVNKRRESLRKKRERERARQRELVEKRTRESLRAKQEKPADNQSIHRMGKDHTSSLQRADLLEEPEGPPPGPKKEIKPPKPSSRAQWVPGYWKWTGRGWQWLQGWWRVPESDLRSNLTVRVEQEPPPLKYEQPPPKPFPSAVWAPGYWQWTGREFVWVSGAWRQPPTQRHRWRKSKWRKGKRGEIIFVPGGWIIETR